MAVAAIAAVVLVLLVLGVRGRRRRGRITEHAAGIALAGRPWDGPTRMNKRPVGRHPGAAARREKRRG